MSRRHAEVVVCGAGIAGVAVAYELAVHRGVENVLLIDAGAPLSLTSDKSTECYRNWWPGPGDAMVRLMNTSIDRLEERARESGNRFLLNRRGYLYASACDARVETFRAAAEEAASLGAGPVRLHQGESARYQPGFPEGFENHPTGADIIVGRDLLAALFPFLSEHAVVALHARRCGWLSAQQLGMYLLERARDAGVRFQRAELSAVETAGGRVRSVSIECAGDSVGDGASGSQRIETSRLVIATGPMVNQTAALLGLQLPIFSERHIKVTFEDHHRAVPRDAPLVIWTDAVHLPWDPEERAALAEDPDSTYLLEAFAAGVHARPVGTGSSLIVYWTYDCEPTEATFPLEWDPHLPEITLRGMSRAVPRLAEYFAQGRMPKPFVDGGYYTKTRENRPLMGPLPVEGAFVHAAFSGFGIMAALGAAELTADHVLGETLPGHAGAFTLARYDDPQYQSWLENWNDSGQL